MITPRTMFLSIATNPYGTRASGIDAAEIVGAFNRTSNGANS